MAFIQVPIKLILYVLFIKQYNMILYFFDAIFFHFYCYLVSYQVPFFIPTPDYCEVVKRKLQLIVMSVAMVIKCRIVFS